MNTYGIWYDIDAFKAAGIPVPAAGWTWDQMYEAAAKLHEKGAKYGLVADAMTALDAPSASASTPSSPAARPSPTTSTTPPRSPSTPRTPKASASSWQGSTAAP